MQTNFKQGLSKEEVKGESNNLAIMSWMRRKTVCFNLVFSQFKDFMIVVLLVATLISGLLGEYIDAIAIIAIVILNGVLGFQERRAEKSLEAESYQVLLPTY